MNFLITVKVIGPFFKVDSWQLVPLATVLVTSQTWATEKVSWNNISTLRYWNSLITEYIETTLPQDN